MAGAGESLRPDANGALDQTSVVPDTNTEATQLEGSSDGESERATRERLKQTSIAGIAQQAKSNDEETVTDPTQLPTSSDRPDIDSSVAGDGTRGRPTKKRSFEDLTRGDPSIEDNGQNTADADQPNPKSGHHKRMRSRDVASGDHAVARFEGTDVASPVQEESDAEAHKSPGGPGILVDVANENNHMTSNSTAAAASEATNKVSSEQKPDTTKIAPSSGFANASSTSPFGATQTSTKPAADVKSTSASAFASSGLSAFASSEKSPFGAATQSTGAFGAKPTSSTRFGSTGSAFGSSSSSFASKPANSGFGSATGFGSTSGFGSSTGFGTAKSFGTGASTFGGNATTTSSFGTGKPFAASKSKDDGDNGSDDDAEEDDTPHIDATDEQDERFVAQDVETGEEEERTVFACRAKLYHFEKEWKERGVGTIKINMKEEELDISETTTAAEDDIEAGTGSGKGATVRRGRLIMRTDGVHRVILNTPIFKSMTIGQSDGSEPFGKTMHLTGLEDGKPRAFQIKIGKEEVIKELYWKVVDLRTEAKA